MLDLEPMVVRLGVLECRVCIPKGWSDSQALAFVTTANPFGTRAGWEMRKKGSPYLQGSPERCPCDERKGFVHITFDA